VILTFDLMTIKTLRVILWSGPTTTANLKILGRTNWQILNGNDSTTEGHSDLDLGPSDLKNNRGHLHVMPNNHSKFKNSRLNRLAVIDRKPFDLIFQLKVTVTLTFDLVT